jgi:light-regulated signal transduction histidine kinase (bacteriophytochrome)
LIAAWLGYGPGLLSYALSFFVAPYFFVPKFWPAKIDLNRLVLTLLVSLLVSRVSAIRKRTEQLLRTANAELDQRVQQRTAELERSNADLEQFAYAASHDLQEPLRNVATHTQLLKKGYYGKLDDEADQLLITIVSSAKRMGLLIQDLLAYTQITRQSEEAPQPVNAHAVLAKVIFDLQALIADTHASVRDGDLPTLQIQEVHLHQLFLNLVGNAIKYRGDKPPEVYVSARREGAEWLFSVKDNGIGIAPQYAGRVFGMFRRLHGPEEYAGTGIRLAICQKIVERHRGRIWVESEPGKGSTFFFTLPA